MDIRQFRDFVNRFHTNFVIHCYSNVEGKNYWSCLCSAMDWLTEAEDALPEFQKRANGKNAGWIDLYGYISCIDVILEATEQLHRCVFGVAGKPTDLLFHTQCFIAKPNEFASLTDRAYFKELRSGFGAHPVNLTDSQRTSSHKHKAKRYASWVLSSERGQPTDDFDFSVRLYSNLKGVEDLTLGVKLAELKTFCDQYQSHLETVVAEIERQYGVFANECRKRPIGRSDDIVEQWNILMREAGDRCLGNWDAAVPDIFSANPKNPKNRKLLAAYQKALRTLIKGMTSAFQKMNDEGIQKIGENFHQALYPPHPQAKGLSYSLQKLFTSDLPYSVLKKEIEEFFGNQIDFRSISSDVERQVLVRAALYDLSNDEPLKQVLRTRCLPDLKEKSAYFSRKALLEWLKGARVKYTAATLNRYMTELADAGFLWNAGRGWYSFISNSAQLDAEPLAGIKKDMQERFPLLDYACWSTQQVNPYMHHMLGKSVTFVLAPPDALASVYDDLRDRGYSAYLNPNEREVGKTFKVDAKTVVLRKLNTLHTPVQDHLLSVEALLVDLSQESERLFLMDKTEFRQMAARLVSSARVDFASLASYAKLRGVAVTDLFQNSESIIYSF